MRYAILMALVLAAMGCGGPQDAEQAGWPYPPAGCEYTTSTGGWLRCDLRGDPNGVAFCEQLCHAGPYGEWTDGFVTCQCASR